MVIEKLRDILYQLRPELPIRPTVEFGYNEEAKTPIIVASSTVKRTMRRHLGDDGLPTGTMELKLPPKDLNEVAGFGFGKHRGKTLRHIIEQDWHYVEWAMEAVRAEGHQCHPQILKLAFMGNVILNNVDRMPEMVPISSMQTLSPFEMEKELSTGSSSS